MEDKVCLAMGGDEEAFTYLINSKKEQLYRTAFAYVKNKEDALDIIQETVYKAYISIDKLKESKYFNTWLTRILINNAITFINKNSKIVYLEENELKDMSHLENKSDEKLDLLYAVDKLEEKLKKVIILKYLNDLTISEVAKVLEIPEGTAKTYLNKGLSKLKIHFGKELI
ncbi:sigma-70 family RNA polymerase sigma factor [Clostridium uliginosum]|uniref:RNA polymerase sigma-70 factor, ECF subfamily n=1 Tax=Clostridium uliginosum TaxID=119641 RepID=A0A1I1IEE7_9CLOT|nr:sigma-70 family RNA polymerase sigma factor [Clostridium uliginosum]SFC34341.1 RNA polymerase sigma-70 factor, ECF subfamily [Clostridium uliginosum]